MVLNLGSSLESPGSFKTDTWVALRDSDLIGLGCGPEPQDCFKSPPDDANDAGEEENHCFR